MAVKAPQTLVVRVFAWLSRGNLVGLLPFCMLAGSVLFYYDPPDPTRYDATTWILQGGLSGLVIGAVAIGFLTIISWMT